MNLNEKAKIDFDDILIKPKTTTSIKSRSEINPFDSEGYLPIITAPMDTVVDSENANLFLSKKIKVCLPRGEKRTELSTFQSYSLSQFVDEFLKIKGMKTWSKSSFPIYVLIDTANGHIDEVIESVRKAKDIFNDDMVLMVGNIANPETYRLLSDAGADYVRIGIGNGGGCLTTQQLGIGYPMASLINECYNISFSLDHPAKIVADGGMQKYSDIIKALALGADYVMLGSILNKCLESCGENYETDSIDSKLELKKEELSSRFKNGKDIFKMFRGMSTKEVQRKWGNETLKTSEGVVRFRKVEYTIDQWVDNFESYLRSAMSYCDARTLEEFVDNSEFITITENAFKRFSK